MKLGRISAPLPASTLFLSAYQTAPFQSPPEFSNFLPNATYSTYGNTQIGDCTIAAAFNAIETLKASPIPIYPDTLAIETYSSVTGYSPANPATDRGAVVADVLSAWSTSGFPLSALNQNFSASVDKLDAFCHILPKDIPLIKQAIVEFGGIYLGLLLPISAQAPGPWTLNPSSPPWGGHAVWAAAYDAEGLTCITWGSPKKMTWDFFTAYTEEAWPLLSKDHVSSNFSLEKLRSDFNAL